MVLGSLAQLSMHVVSIFTSAQEAGINYSALTDLIQHLVGCMTLAVSPVD